ncbi:MAG: hypothetical protein ACXVJ7_12830 [Acidimicrobiia bacterium]
MFIDDFVKIRRNVLIANAWLISHGHEIAREAVPPFAGGSVTLGDPRTRSDVLVLPVTWYGSPDAPFAVLEGDLQTARLDESTTHLALIGSCDIRVEPPGRRAQERAAQRAAEHAIREFLGRLAQQLEVRSNPGAG